MSLELPSPDVLATLAVQIRVSFKELTMCECAESALECWESCADLLERTRRDYFECERRSDAGCAAECATLNAAQLSADANKAN
jgi:hypothetical protein